MVLAGAKNIQRIPSLGILDKGIKNRYTLYRNYLILFRPHQGMIMQKILERLGFAAVLCSTFSIYADDDAEDLQWKALMNEAPLNKPPSSAKLLAQVNQQTTPSPKRSIKKSHFALYGDFLYWNTYLSDYSWTYAFNDTVEPSTYDYKNVNFHWDVGFRIGTWVKTEQQEVIFDFNWTQFHTRVTPTYLDPVVENADVNRGFYPFLIDPSIHLADPSYGHAYLAEGSFKMQLDQFDLTMKKDFHVIHNRLILSPFGGVRGLFLTYKSNQTFTYNFNGTQFSSTFPKNELTLNEKNKAWTVAALAGLTGTLNLGSGFGFFFGADTALGGGHDQFIYQPSSLIEGVSTGGRSTNNSSKFRAIIDVDTGLMWNQTPSYSRWNIGLKVAYEAHLYLDSLTLINYDTPSQNLNLMFQGLTARGVLRF